MDILKHTQQIQFRMFRSFFTWTFSIKNEIFWTQSVVCVLVYPLFSLILHLLFKSTIIYLSSLSLSLYIYIYIYAPPRKRKTLFMNWAFRLLISVYVNDYVHSKFLCLRWGGDGFGVRYPTDVKSAGFRSQLVVSRESSHTEKLWYNETISLWMTIYIYEE